MSDNVMFAHESDLEEDDYNLTEPTIKVLLVDDEPEVHQVTDLTLKRFCFEGRPVEFLHAYSAEQARQLFEQHNDIALALIDVVMETDHAGLELVRYVRSNLKNRMCRLVLRTGQPGQAPEHEVIEKYDINDYKEKTELTSQKLRTLMYAGLRSYRDIQTIEQHRTGLRRVIECTSQVLRSNSMTTFASAVLKEMMNLLQITSSAIYCSTIHDEQTQSRLNSRVLAATGKLVEHMQETSLDVLPPKVQRCFSRALDAKKSQYFDDCYVFYTRTESGHENVLYVDTQGPLEEVQRELLEIYCINVALTYENLLIGEEIIDTQRELVYLLGEAVEMRSKETGAHVKRVALMSHKLAKYYGLSDIDALVIKRASPLHDLGKVAIPDSILHNPGELHSDEWQIMQTHAQVGHDILAKSRKPILKVAAEIALTHHEKWDGNGYPQGLKGENIPLCGRITALADVFDALGSKRCYKEPWGQQQIRALIRQQSGQHFDPQLVDILLANFDEFCRIRHQFPD